MTRISTSPGKANLVCSLATHGENDKRSLQISHGDTQSALTISFERTLRVPDNNGVNFLPPSLGRFPLFSVAEYKQRLPPDMAAKGGIFFPMMQREAMWMQFSAKRPFAVKIYVGGVNAISGVPMTETPEAAKNRLKSSEKVKQDYVVLPDQPWLDGIVTEDGQIRQFVAMPKGSGYSVEAQVTGEEKIDGIQFEVTPVKLGVHDVLNMRYSSQLGLYQSTPLNKTVQLTRVFNSESTVMDLKKLAAQEFGFNISDQTFSITANSTSTALNEAEDSNKLSNMYFLPDCILDIKEKSQILEQIVTPVRKCSSHTKSSLLGFSGFSGLSFGAANAASAVPAPPPAPLASISLLGATTPLLGKMTPMPTGGAQKKKMLHSAAPQQMMQQMMEQSLQPMYDSSSINAPGSGASLDTFAESQRLRAADDKVARASPCRPVLAKPAPEIKAMGLAAGGNIQQSINIDNYPPSLWDPSNTILFNVQLLNWEAFEAVTGGTPPDPPLDAAVYAKHNMPFFQIWNEEKSGIKGDFAKVKSIGEIDEDKAMEKNAFWAQMKGEAAEGAEKENLVDFKRDPNLEFPVVLLDMKGRSLFKPIKEMEADLAKMKLDD